MECSLSALRQMALTRIRRTWDKLLLLVLLGLRVLP